MSQNYTKLGRKYVENHEVSTLTATPDELIDYIRRAADYAVGFMEGYVDTCVSVATQMQHEGLDREQIERVVQEDLDDVKSERRRRIMKNRQALEILIAILENIN